MAESGETIREMLAGFNSMQAQLGLLPPQTGQMPMGVQLNQPPPPPPIMHPGQFAALAVQQHQSAAQNTIQFAQMTRYQPPPSAPIGNPFTWAPTMQGIGSNQFSPQQANFMAGGGAPGLPSPLFSTAPQFGMYRPPAAATHLQSFIPNAPHIFNPTALPGPMFQQPYQRDLQLSRAQQGGAAAGVLGAVQGGFELGGGVLGGALGAAFLGPLGELAGNWVGTRVGAFAGRAITGTVGRDLARGIQVQNATAPFMVTGPHLDPFTGQGLSRQAGYDTAVGLRRMARDWDFGRQTGFNTADVMNIFQGAADQGLLATAQNPDEMIRRVKEASKAIRVITQLTGDADVKAALRDLGNMRSLGFEGLANQMGGLANRASFARMAGVSQGALDSQFGMPGALMAQQVGLAGATGYSAGIGGAGMANIAISAGALSDLQLARAGGRQGLAQGLAMSSLGGVNQDLWMAAALTKRGGKLDFDMDAFRSAQQMSPGQVAAEASRRMRSLGIRSLTEMRVRLPEFKDRAAQLMDPMEMQLNAFDQVERYAQTTGLSIEAAFLQMNGGDANQAAAQAQLYRSGGFYTGMQQQLGINARGARDRRMAGLAQYRQPGLLTRAGRGISGAISGVGDWVSGGVGGALNAMNAHSESNMAFERGEYINRSTANELIQSPADRAAAEAYIRGGSAADLAARAGRDLGGSTSLANALGAAVGISDLSGANRRTRLATEAAGYTGLLRNVMALGQTDVGATAELSNVGRAGRAATRGIAATPGSTAARAMMENLQRTGQAAARGRGFDMNSAVMAVAAKASGRLDRDGTLVDGSAMRMEQVLEPWIEHLKGSGWSEKEARAFVNANADDLVASTVSQMYTFLDEKGKRAVNRSQEIAEKVGGAQGLGRTREQARADLESRLGDLGMTTEAARPVLEAMSKTSATVVSRATLRARAAQGDTEATRQLAALNKDKSFDEVRQLNEQADALYATVDDKTKSSLQKSFQGGPGSFQQRMQAANVANVGTKVAQARQTALSQLNEMLGITGEDVDYTLASFGKLSDTEIAEKLKGHEDLQAAVKTYRTNKGAGRTQFELASLSMGATQQTQTGGALTPEQQKLHDRIEEAKKKRAATGASVDDQFAVAVDDLSQAAKDLKDVTYNIMMSNPKSWMDKRPGEK